MRFAVVSEVQANLSALRAVLDAIDALPQPMERIVCTGDVVGLGPHPNEVIDMLRERQVDVVKGNYDDAVAFERLGSGVDHPDADAERAERTAIAWTRRSLTPDNLAYLQELPQDMRMTNTAGIMQVRKNEGDPAVAEYRRGFISRALFGSLASGGTRGLRAGKRILFVHGTTRSLNEHVRPDTANSLLRAIASEARADVLFTGHSGVSFQRNLDATIFIGVGSLGRSQLGPDQTEFAIVEVGKEFSVEFQQLRYDPVDHARALYKLQATEPGIS